MLTAHKLAKELKEYDITSDRARLGDRTRGYWSDEIEAAVEKYKAEHSSRETKRSRATTRRRKEVMSMEESDDTDAEDPF